MSEWPGSRMVMKEEMKQIHRYRKYRVSSRKSKKLEQGGHEREREGEMGTCCVRAQCLSVLAAQLNSTSSLSDKHSLKLQHSSFWCVTSSQGRSILIMVLPWPWFMRKHPTTFTLASPQASSPLVLSICSPSCHLSPRLCQSDLDVSLTVLVHASACPSFHTSGLHCLTSQSTDHELIIIPFFSSQFQSYL